MAMPGVRQSLNEDTLTSHIIKDEAMQDTERPTELLPHAKHVALTKQSRQQGQRGKQSGGGSDGGKSVKEAHRSKSARDNGSGGGVRRWECWLFSDPDHLSYECQDCKESDDDNKGGCGKSNGSRRRRDNKLLKEKQPSKSTPPTKDDDSSACKGRGDGEASCSMVGVVESTVSLALETAEGSSSVGPSPESKGWEVLDFTDNKVVTTVEAIFYETINLRLMQLDMKNAFLQSKLDHVLYMYQPDYYNNGTGRVCKLLKSLYGLKQTPLLWYKALDDVLAGADWKKSHVDEALYFKVGDDGVACWVLVYVDDLLVTSTSLTMLKELLEAAFELREIKPVKKNLGLEIVHNRPARKLWLHQQVYIDKLHRRFIDEEQTGRVPKMPVSVDTYEELTFDDEDAHLREEEEYRQKVGSLQFAAMTTRPDIAFVCSKFGSGLTVRSDNHWREVDRSLHYLASTREFGGRQMSLCIVGYADADDASDKQNRTSTGGYVFVFGGAAVS
ncbi:unnamed protein product [Closterium sp. NIES-53]